MTASRRRYGDRPGLRATPLLLALFALGGCGGTSPTVADCLNNQRFLVVQDAHTVRGSSPRGVNFTLTIYSNAASARRAATRVEAREHALLGDGVVSFAGNPPASPDAAPGRLSRSALATIGRCVAHP